MFIQISAKKHSDNLFLLSFLSFFGILTNTAFAHEAFHLPREGAVQKMQRVLDREKAFILLFENSFHNYSLNEIASVKSFLSGKEYAVSKFTKDVFCGALENKEKLDYLISAHTVKWDKERLSRVSLCILRIALYEILFRDDIPENVSASEAVNLAKKYGTDSEYTFVNGILGTVCSKSKEGKLINCAG